MSLKTLDERYYAEPRRKVKSRLSKCMVDEANVVGSDVAVDRVRDSRCVLECVLVLAFGNRWTSMQAPCKLGGYVQEGRGDPAGSSHTRPAVPTEALRSADKLLRSKAFARESVATKLLLMSRCVLISSLAEAWAWECRWYRTRRDP
jgi:hypothetical protein